MCHPAPTSSPAHPDREHRRVGTGRAGRRHPAEPGVGEVAGQPRRASRPGPVRERPCRDQHPDAAEHDPHDGEGGTVDRAAMPPPPPPRPWNALRERDVRSFGLVNLTYVDSPESAGEKEAGCRFTSCDEGRAQSP